MNPEFPAQSFYRPAISAAVQAHIRDQGACHHGPEVCRLRDGCHLVAHGAFCQRVCMVWIGER